MTLDNNAQFFKIKGIPCIALIIFHYDLDLSFKGIVHFKIKILSSFT